ncbi:hypothetical protein [Ligilactobacillus saerimneri]|uniref:hypothetical protein n=1 Tax=Ligilactobacillus saerimneri TaxID=228229 RepID=UPI003F25E3ED
MNINTAYLLGMILGNGEIQKGPASTTITIDIPYKNLKTDDNNDVQIYVKASLFDILPILQKAVGNDIVTSSAKNATKISFTKDNNSQCIQEILQYIDSGNKQQNFKMSAKIFSLSRDYIRSLLRGIADVTAYIRKTNIAYGKPGAHRVYIEVPQNWYMVIDIANLLKSVDVPIQNIDFGHPNFRDGKMKKFNNGKPNFWKKEHQIKIWANEFLPIGFNIQHKEEALKKYADQLLNHSNLTIEKTHLFYWQTPTRRRFKAKHPGENDPSLPKAIRGKHYESWKDLAKDLGYHA